jgi:hypothetical protein
MAVDVLSHLHRNKARNNISLPRYDDKLLVEESMLLPDWYYPALTGKTAAETMRESYREVWKGLFSKFPKDQETLVLRDYHVDNLMLTRGEGIGRCGLLDFQDAVVGQFSYDLMSLLEDARRDVPQELQKHLYDRYMTSVGGSVDRKAFDYSYRVLAAQRHAKVLGIFVRLFVRDKKERYLQFIPHVHKLFLASLNDASLKPLKDWFDGNSIDIAAPLKIAQK